MQIMIVSTTLFLAAGRFGLAPTSNAHTKAGVKLYEENDSGVASNDPSGAHREQSNGDVLLRVHAAQLQYRLITRQNTSTGGC